MSEKNDFVDINIACGMHYDSNKSAALNLKTISNGFFILAYKEKGYEQSFLALVRPTLKKQKISG
ncbi:hypothetical protein LBE40_01925 [Bartonella taylorii]|uniref:Uncharacterized protein n=1 Tax=Bartonella taylorii TaxID=33046 RepID=A0A9Q8YZ19_BARTA|nr:hypothetical protein [Bartonella taylorii]USP01597.1 hypothetical protein LBE40_01925 [Bartonella taylorii]USP03322.1 hypothetical protein LAJ60_02495 [Bartonella taylorii]